MTVATAVVTTSQCATGSSKSRGMTAGSVGATQSRLREPPPADQEAGEGRETFVNVVAATEQVPSVRQRFFASSKSRSRLGDAEIGRPLGAASLDELGSELAQQPQDELRPADALSPELDRNVFEVDPYGVDVRRVPDPELHVHRRGRPNHLRHLVEAHETALVVRHLDVDVERSRACPP